MDYSSPESAYLLNVSSRTKKSSGVLSQLFLLVQHTMEMMVVMCVVIILITSQGLLLQYKPPLSLFPFYRSFLFPFAPQCHFPQSPMQEAGFKSGSANPRDS